MLLTSELKTNEQGSAQNSGESYSIILPLVLPYRFREFELSGLRIFYRFKLLGLHLTASLLVFLISGFVFLPIATGECSLADSTFSSTETESDSVRITIAFAGDVLMHIPIVNSARLSDGTYDFNPIFEYIAPYLKYPDLTVINLETRLAGEERGFSGYPCFNSPESLANALLNAGVDVAACANNHCMDRGISGLYATLDNLDKAGLPHIGNYRSANERNTPFVIDVKGIKIALLNYTYCTNGIPVPKDATYAVNLVDERTIIADTDAAMKAKSDLQIVFLHNGEEYQREPNSEQINLAEELVDSGVDAVIATHAHVVQPIDIASVERTLPGTDRTVVENRPIVYSMGNFLSDQRQRYRDSGIIVFLTIEKDKTGANVTGIEYLPVYVRKCYSGTGRTYQVLPVHPDIKLNIEPPLTNSDIERMEDIWNELTTHIDMYGKGVKAIEIV
jgi:poly-gamma-glutamate capsule biosynthesis protein CapA/YwtB (metallophosphatase superfamily)